MQKKILKISDNGLFIVQGDLASSTRIHNYVRIMPKCKKNAEIEGTQAIC